MITEQKQNKEIEQAAKQAVEEMVTLNIQG